MRGARSPWTRCWPRYLDTDGRPLTDAAAVERITALVIPPAWTRGWTCPHERGHIQATGYDAAGRKQYLYHPVWRRTRDEAGVEHVHPVEDGEVCQVLRDLRRRRRGERRLFAYWDAPARRWREVSADEINEYLRDISGEQLSTKDLRTWHSSCSVEADPTEALSGVP